MPRLRYVEALGLAIRHEMESDPKVAVLGEDVGESMRRVTAGLLERFGPGRVIDTPLSEQAFTGLATGAAMRGFRPVVEYEIPPLLYIAFDQIINHATKIHLMSGGTASVPVTYIVPGSGARNGSGAQHADNPYASLVHAGLTTVVPSNVQDAYALTRAAIRCDDPVAVIAPAPLLGARGTVEGVEGDFSTDLMRGAIRRPGTDLTVVAIGHMVNAAVTVADELADTASIEVLDPRTICPFDWSLLFESLGKTKRLVVAEDTSPACGLSGDIVATAVANFDLVSRPRRVTRAEGFMPFRPELESSLLPDLHDLRSAILSTIGERHGDGTRSGA